MTRRKFRTSLGPVEQAQIVISTAVVVTLITIVAVRLTSGRTIELLLFGSVITVGIFGFLIVFFTLKYGRLLEEQKQELLALNSFAESVNRAIDVQILLHNALLEMKRLLQINFGWIYILEGEKLVLRVSRGVEELNFSIINTHGSINDENIRWINNPRIVKRPKKSKKENKKWEYGIIGSWASIPIMMKDQLSGLIILASKSVETFSPKQIELVMAFANQIGVAMENAVLFERVRKSEERFIDLFEHSPDMTHIIDRNGIITRCNQTEATRLGYSKEELIGQSILKLYLPEHHKEALNNLHEIFEKNREVKGLEEKIVTKNKEIIEVSVNASIISDESGEKFVRAVARDITEKKKLEAKVIHAQRIDSIGNLAGGVAHDFNNILTSILGSTSIMKRKLKETDHWYRYAEIIETAARRGASLTRQLLTFARKSNVQFHPIIANDIIEETIGLFERSTDKTISIEKDLIQEVCVINGDEGLIQQSILNILINARDAMPEGGVIYVKSHKKYVGKDTAPAPEIKEGEYVAISISDTGIGMDKETMQHIFEPFFTTKDQGKGTGLGLSVVYGVVNTHNGFINVQSEIQKGSIFELHLPIMSPKKTSKRIVKHIKFEQGNEEVLIVDDEKDVSEVINGMLSGLGYKVTMVDSGQKAVNILKKKNNIKVVILDLNMPKMSGRETFNKIKKINSNLHVIISTGYSNRSQDAAILQEIADAFLQKPYQIEELAKTMRQVLDYKSKQKQQI